MLKRLDNMYYAKFREAIIKKKSPQNVSSNVTVVEHMDWV
jgi:hypothetical protein